GVQVDGARSDKQSRGIQHLSRIAALQLADFGDLAVLNAEVGVIAWQPRTIDDHAVLNDCIELCHKTLLFVDGRSRARVGLMGQLCRIRKIEKRVQQAAPCRAPETRQEWAV